MEEVEDLETIMQIYSLTEYSDRCAKATSNLPKYYWVGLNDAINTSELFKFKLQINDPTSGDGGVDYSDINNVIVVPLK